MKRLFDSEGDGCGVVFFYALGLLVLVWLSYSSVGQYVMLYLR